MTRTIAIADGDGIGPEIMAVTLELLQAAGADLRFEKVTIGSAAFEQGVASGIAPEAWQQIRQHQVLLKGPLDSLQSHHNGVKNLNVSLRQQLGLYANVRPCLSYAPFVPSRHPQLDVVIVRENEEDLYGGLEYRQTTDVVEGLKLISRPGCEKIIRYAFEYARFHKRQKVTALSKDKIMEFTDGFFHQIFCEIATDYPELQSEHQSLDIGTARLLTHPQHFDVIVIPNLYGDILSDLLAQITTGSASLAAAANFGEHSVIFEAIHGPAHSLAQQDLANPSGLLLAGVMLLEHVGQTAPAQRLHNAWLKTLEDGIHTSDIYSEGHSQQRVGTRAFAEAIKARLGQQPHQLKAVHYADNSSFTFLSPASPGPSGSKSLIGVDVFLDWRSEDASLLGQSLQALEPAAGPLQLELISNLGVTVWPQIFPETRRSDHWHCRFRAPQPIQPAEIYALLQRIAEAGYDFIKTENLYLMDGAAAFSG